MEERKCFGCGHVIEFCSCVDTRDAPPDGSRLPLVSLYKIVIGEYSDRSESWFWHPQKMEYGEFYQLLRKTWFDVTKPKLERLHHERDRECADVFGITDRVDFVGRIAINSTVYFEQYAKRGTHERFVEFRKKEPEAWEDFHEVLMRDAGFAPVEALGEICLSPPWMLDDFEKELIHETESS